MQIVIIKQIPASQSSTIHHYVVNTYQLQIYIFNEMIHEIFLRYNIFSLFYDSFKNISLIVSGPLSKGGENQSFQEKSPDRLLSPLYTEWSSNHGGGISSV